MPIAHDDDPWRGGIDDEGRMRSLEVRSIGTGFRDKKHTGSFLSPAGRAGCRRMQRIHYSPPVSYLLSTIWPLQRYPVSCDHSFSASQSQPTLIGHQPHISHTLTHVSSRIASDNRHTQAFTSTTHNPTSPLCRAATHRRKASLLRPTSLSASAPNSPMKECYIIQ